MGGRQKESDRRAVLSRSTKPTSPLERDGYERWLTGSRATGFLAIKHFLEEWFMTRSRHSKQCREEYSHGGGTLALGHGLRVSVHPIGSGA